MLTGLKTINKMTHIAKSLGRESILVPASRVLSTQAAPAYADPEWDNAKPFEAIPVQSVRDFFPGGALFRKDLDKIHFHIQERHGNLVRFPGIFGRMEMLMSYDPEDYVKIYRTEGPWPFRMNLDSLTHWRKNVRKDLFSNFKGLVEEHGEPWKKYRTILNPVMMQPKTVALYVSKIDEVAKHFINLTRSSLDSKGETPADYGLWCQRFALESIGLVALDRRLNVLEPTENNTGTKLAAEVDKMFNLVYELDILPSIWRYFRTPTFKKLMKTLDEIADIVMAMVEESVQELERNPSQKSPDQQSVLEKLLKIDKDVAIIMAFDMLVVGIDTTSSSIKSLLYLLAKHPEKQEKLRQEIMAILPDKDSPLTPDNMKNLPYLRACMKEQHRVLPVILGNARAAGEDLVIQGYRVPKGTQIIMAHGVPSLLEEQFSKTNEFIPERWLKDESHAENEGCPHAKNAHPFTYMPFGFGNRACIGKRFAELETAALVSRMVRNFEMSWNYPDPTCKMTIVNGIVSDLKIQLKDI